MHSLSTKHIHLLPQYIRLATSREAEYKVSFYTFMLNQVVSIAIWLIFWKVLISRIGDFGMWNYPLMVLLTGFVAINAGLWLTFIFIWRVPGEILSGALNSHLIKPVHPFLHMICRRLNLRSLPRIIIGIGIIIFALTAYDIPYSPLSILLAAITSLFSFLAVFLPLAMIGLSAFWIGRAEFLRDLFVELFVFQNYPLTEFPNPFIFFFTLVIPVIFSGTIPVLVLRADAISTTLLWLPLLLAIIIVQLLLFNFIWNKGLRRYESFGG